MDPQTPDQDVEAKKAAFAAYVKQLQEGGGAPGMNPGQPPPAAQGAPPNWAPPGQVQPPNWAPPQNQPPVQGAPPNWAPPSQAQIPNQAAAMSQGQPPTSANWTPPPNQAPPSGPVVNEQVLIQARGTHPGWDPGQPWFNGQTLIQPGADGYPPIFMAPQGSAPMPSGAPGTAQAPAPEDGKGKGGRPKKNAEAVALGSSALVMIGNGFLTLAQAVDKGLFG